MIFDINEWYSEKLNNNILFSYKGNLTSGKITRFLDDIEKRVLIHEHNFKLKRKIYNVLVESLQNMYHHGDVLEKGIEFLCDDYDCDELNKFCVIIFQKKDIGYQLTTANFIKNYRVKLVRDKIDQVNALSISDIKTLYKLILKNLEFSERGGGGLGIIDIAKRTESKLMYEFHAYNEDLNFYTLEVNIY